MHAEILMIGTELLLGQIDDTNATFLGRELAANGINLYQKSTVGDNRERIIGALNNALNRSDVVLCSGGLGPTEDDITRECVAELLSRPLEFNEEIWEYIQSLFARYRFKITDNNKRQAMVPRGAIVVHNPNGTAPGLIIDDERGVVACMPGVPRELEHMLIDAVIPWLRERFGLGGLIHYRVLKVCGLGESRVDAAIGDLITGSSNPTVGVLANPAFVRIRIAARADTLTEANFLIDAVEHQVRERLPGMIACIDDETLEGVVNKLLAERGWTLCVVETTSGGIICQRLTAANATQFVGGRVLPMSQLDAQHAREEILDCTRSLMIASASSCGLAVAADPREGHIVAVFFTPDGQSEWEFGRAGTDERLQMRTAVVALEYVRRFLVGAGQATGAL